MYGWRAHEELGKTLGKRIDFFLGEMPRIGPDMLGLSLVALVGLVFCLRRGRGLLWVVPLWFLFGFIAINVGGWYWPHYFVQVVPPLALMAGVAVTAVQPRSRLLAAALLCGAILPVGINLAHLALTSDTGRLNAVAYKRGYQIDRQIARSIREHSTAQDPFYSSPRPAARSSSSSRGARRASTSPGRRRRSWPTGTASSGAPRAVAARPPRRC